MGDWLGEPLFHFAGRQVTVASLLATGAVLVASFLLGRLARRLVQRYFQTQHAENEKTSRYYGIIAELVVWFVGIDIALHVVGVQLTALFAAGGLFALGAGFAVKNLIENFLSGSILRIEKTMAPGDLVTVDGKWLIIQGIGLRCTKAKTYDGVEVLIPNSILAQSHVANLTRGSKLHRIELRVRISYESDLDLVRATLERSVAALKWRSAQKEPAVYLREFDDSSVNYDVTVWIDDAGESRGRRSDLHEAVWKALQEADIEIAYPQLDMHLDPGVTDAAADRRGRIIQHEPDESSTGDPV